jgi:hypothetical protein
VSKGRHRSHRIISCTSELTLIALSSSRAPNVFTYLCFWVVEVAYQNSFSDSCLGCDSTALSKHLLEVAGAILAIHSYSDNCGSDIFRSFVEECARAFYLCPTVVSE